MKRIITYMAAMTALVLAFSCSREAMQDTRTGEGISLQIMWDELATRADGDTEVNNEYAVNSLDWYFYKDVTKAAVFHFHEAIPAADAKAQLYIRDFIPGQSYGGVSFPHRADLCADDDYCTVFVVANLPSEKVQDAPTLTDLKNLEVDETFLSEETVTETDGTRYLVLSADKQEDGLFFIMTGEEKVKGTSLTGTSAKTEKIGLSRLAAKITYDVKVLKSKSTTTNGITETWTPMLGGNNVRMYPQGAIAKALLGVVDGEHYLENPEGFNYASRVVSLDDEMWTNASGDYYVTAEAIGPYYTYPNNWEEGGTDTFVKIIVPWQVTRTQGENVIYSAQREVYYKVLLPDPKTVSNTWYQLEVTLEPGTENEPEVEITAQYKVAGWIGGGQDGVDGNLKDLKYLIADRSDEITESGESHFVTYTSGISIPYSASNPVLFRVTEASFIDYYTEKPSEKKFVENGQFRAPSGTSKIVGTSSNGQSWARVQSISDVQAWFGFDNGSNVGSPEGHLVMNHYLNSVLTSDYFDASPYTFKVEIYLQRDPSFKVEEFIIIQYPQTYIEAQESTVHPDSPAASSSNNFYGYIFINGVSDVTNAGTPSPWTTIMTIGRDYRGQTNHNMYILTTGVLSDSSLKLGDPRTASSTNKAQTVGNNVTSGNRPQGDQTPTFIQAPAVNGGTRSLSNYFPTDAAKSPDFIAPKLRIQSAFGRRGSNKAGNNSSNTQDDYRYNYASAWNRCAAYQEDGYPAGRWRLPTEAEINYINTLSQRNFIPPLFYGGTPYWTATPGLAINDGGDQNVLQASTRCVYDDWYWGSEPVAGAQDTFMWGD